LTPASIASPSGGATANTPWNTTAMRATNATHPHTGCSATASIRLVTVRPRDGARVTARASTPPIHP
jgi:hypothetical protein